MNEDFFSANCPDSLQLALPRPAAAAKTLLARNRDAVLSVLLALKKKPSTIRYAVSSVKQRFTVRLSPLGAEGVNSATRENVSD